MRAIARHCFCAFESWAPWPPTWVLNPPGSNSMNANAFDILATRYTNLFAVTCSKKSRVVLHELISCFLQVTASSYH